MCLATPMKITEIDGNKAVVESSEHSHTVDLNLLKEPRVGDYILAHGDLAISKLPEDEALKILEMIKELPHEH
ncbi:MAG TPA: HypC/HybG/HupF family hydrogenase formation chaperone [Candidatus Campbellbacteria bacterium]|nr:HypC/HybG/HupF family hydrogenase formation chaperone [Candidatus Campbellbacteria bacterium]